MMKCENCEKNEATVHLTQIREGKKVQLNLCKECARKKGFGNPLDDVPFPLAEFLAGMVKDGTTEVGGQVGELECPGCGIKFVEFSKIGRFGCGRCYHAFEKPLEDLFRRIHGSTIHRGRTPRSRGGPKTLLAEEIKLKEDLRQAIDEEDFEEAAIIRDRLRALGSKPRVSDKTGQNK
jgi:protein arginine kinase activator